MRKKNDKTPLFINPYFYFGFFKINNDSDSCVCHWIGLIPSSLVVWTSSKSVLFFFSPFFFFVNYFSANKNLIIIWCKFYAIKVGVFFTGIEIMLFAPPFKPLMLECIWSMDHRFVKSIEVIFHGVLISMNRMGTWSGHKSCVCVSCFFFVFFKVSFRSCVHHWIGLIPVQ